MQLVMPFAASPSDQAVDFIRGEANASALEWVERWPDWPYSIVLLHGPAGSGKTHLSHVFAARSRATFLPPERVGEVPADHLMVGNHCWILDGLDAVVDEAALAQLINYARARGDYLLITAREGAGEHRFRLPDLGSRMRALPAITLGAPDDALLTGVLAKSFSDLQLRIAPEVLGYAIQHLERSYQAVQQFVIEIDRLSLTRGRAITVPLVREALRS